MAKIAFGLCYRRLSRPFGKDIKHQGSRPALSPKILRTSFHGNRLIHSGNALRTAGKGVFL